MQGTFPCLFIYIAAIKCYVTKYLWNEYMGIYFIDDAS